MEGKNGESPGKQDTCIRHPEHPEKEPGVTSAMLIKWLLPHHLIFTLCPICPQDSRSRVNEQTHLKVQGAKGQTRYKSRFLCLPNQFCGSHEIQSDLLDQGIAPLVVLDGKELQYYLFQSMLISSHLSSYLDSTIQRAKIIKLLMNMHLSTEKLCFLHCVLIKKNT